MYRVELKVHIQVVCLVFLLTVPNVPCGVERSLPRCALMRAVISSFLMYRVELKELLASYEHSLFKRFLMYRVELKDDVEEKLVELLAVICS